MDSKIINNILIVRLSSLGDVLLTTPVIRALKKKYPTSKIDFIVKKEYSDAVRLNPNVNETIIHSDGEKFLPGLKKKNYDLIIDLQNNFRSRRIISVLNIPFVYFKKPTLKKFLLVNFKINLLKDCKPMSQRYVESINELELDNDGLELYVPSGLNPDIFKDGNYIGICPCAKHFTKRWPEEYFIELGNSLREKGYPIVIFGGKDDLEICSKVSDSIKDSINLCNENDLFRTAVNMKNCKLVICNDSGLMHTASAMKVPVVAFFGSSVKELGFSPYKNENLILENNSLTCRPCSHIGKEHCPKRHFKCMNDVTPVSALTEVLKFIS